MKLGPTIYSPMQVEAISGSLHSPLSAQVLLAGPSSWNPSLHSYAHSSLKLDLPLVHLEGTTMAFGMDLRGEQLTAEEQEWNKLVNDTLLLLFYLVNMILFL